MKKDLSREIALPEGVSAVLEKRVLQIQGPKGSVAREMEAKIITEKNGKNIILRMQQATKTGKKILNTFAAHVKNMIQGVQEPFVYRLKICNVHFPMTVHVEGRNLIVKNFLGEVRERKAPILDGVEVKVEKDIITVSSADKEKAGQTSANIERATYIRMRDRRVFQDGIFLIEKAGEEI
jgi:large subunit ribosomal protein L6